MKNYLIAAFAVLAMGCSAQEAAKVASIEQSSSARAPVGQPYTFSVSDANLYMSYSWSLVDDATGQDVSVLCGDPALSFFTCTVSQVGTYTASVIAQRRSGGAETISYNVTFYDAINANRAPRIRFLVCRPGDSDSNCAADIDQFSLSGSTELEQGQLAFRFLGYTVDDSDSDSDLTYEISIDGGDFQAYTSGSSILFDDPDIAPGLIPVTVRVTDSEGAFALRSFAINLTCTASEASNFVVSAPIVSSDGSVNGNMMTFDASGGAISAARGPLAYAWDFNADQMLDGTGVQGVNWTDQAVMNMINLYDGLRTYRLRVLDRGCNITQSVQFDVDPNIGRLPTPISLAQAYAAFGSAAPYIQADIASLSSEMPSHADAEFIAKQPPTTPQDEFRVTCSYNENGRIEVRGHWDYNKLNAADHGLVLTFGGVNHQAVLNQETQSINGGSNLQNLVYISDKEEDGLNQVFYSKNSNCSFEAEVTGLPPSGGTCSDGVTAQVPYTVEVHGIFSCGSLSSSIGNISATNGAFYCQIMGPTQCVGGGGGGGTPVIPE